MHPSSPPLSFWKPCIALVCAPRYGADMTILIPIFGDQLSHGLSSLAGQDKKACVILMAEVDEETEYVPHHKSKMAFILSAMRHHAEDLRSAGWTVDYVKLTDANNSGSLTGEVARAIERQKISALRVTEAGEWRVMAMLDSWPDRFDVPVTILPDDRFLCTHGEFERWTKDRKQLRMEFFYRDMRRKSGLLMHGDAPEGGQWNFDAENRKPAKRDLTMPRPLHFPPNAVTQDVIQMVEDRHRTDGPVRLRRDPCRCIAAATAFPGACFAPFWRLSGRDAHGRAVFMARDTLSLYQFGLA